ncbi:MAG TPA: hydrolase [Roseiflexaceae bacterium]|nr:hydrolase [Roseiflexaceae bacterium]
MTTTNQFLSVIARLLAESSGVAPARVEALVQEVLEGHGHPTKAKLEELQQRITHVLDGKDTIDLVYGGATKIKDYVFEAPKLPEIRGASTLLDWVNEVKLPDLWQVPSGANPADYGIIYASGGNILAFVPTGRGQQRAREIEAAYTEHTQTANSVAVCRTCHLIELRYGREPWRYWVEDFLRDWQNERLRNVLQEYYYSPYPDDQEDPKKRFFRRKTFGELATLLAIDFYRRRSERCFDEGPSFFPRQPWDERCDSSDLRPAVLEQTFDDGVRHLSLATARKTALGRLIKNDKDTSAWRLAKEIDFADTADQIVEDERSWDRRWTSHLKGNADSPYARVPGALQAKPARDVHEIAGAGGEIAMIYADGNNIGQLMARLTTPQLYARVSKLLSEGTQAAVLGALAEVLSPIDGIHPFEILTVGGDDLLLLVPGDRALAVALEIGRRFERDVSAKLEEVFAKLDGEERLTRSQLLRDRYRRGGKPQVDELAELRPQLGLSAGVVIARDNTPIFHLRNLSEELLKSAKKKARRHIEHDHYGGAVDFMSLRSVSIVADRIETFRKHALQSSDTSLTARPYSWHELAGLLETVRALRKARVPISQLHRLREILVEALARGIAPSVLEYLFARTRMQPRYAEALVDHIEQAWQAPAHVQGAPGVPPWMRVENGGLETVWADMLEIYDLAGEEQDHGPDRD